MPAPRPVGHASGATAGPAPARQFVTATFVDALGTGLWLPMALLFLVHGQGLRLVDAGAALSVGAVAGLVAGPAAGAVLDRIGAPTVLITANVVGLVAYCMYPLVHAPWQVALVAALATSGDRLFWTANAPFVAELTSGREAERVLATQAVGRFIGAGIGAAASVLLPTSTSAATYHLLAYVNAGSYAVALLLILRLRPRLPSRPCGHSPTAPERGRWSTVLRNRPYVGLCATNLLFALASASKYAILPVLVRDVLHGPQWIPGVAIAAGTLVIIFGQRPITTWLGRWPRGTGLIAAATVYTVGFLALTPVASVPLGVATVLILAASPVLSLGDAMFAPLTMAAAAAAAPRAAQGRASATYQLSWGVAAMIAPTMLTGLLTVGTAALWLTVAALSASAVPAVRAVRRALPPAVLDT